MTPVLTLPFLAAYYNAACCLLLSCLFFPNRSLSNARDVGEWLGASGHATFNFAPGVRPVPLEIHMHGLDIHNFEARMQVCSLCCMMWLLDAAAVLSPSSAFRIVWLWRLAWVLFWVVC